MKIKTLIEKAHEDDDWNTLVLDIAALTRVMEIYGAD